MTVAHRYVLLLRGVNVGGRRPVPKAQFQTVLEELGFTDVTIYLNSGNAVFASNTHPHRQTIQSALESHCGFEIPTLLLPGHQAVSIAQALPRDWVYDKPSAEKNGAYTQVAYLFDKVDSPDFPTQIGYQPEVESCIYVPGALLHTVSQADWPRSCLAKLQRKKGYADVTVRNVNTARALADIVKQI